MTNYEKMLKDNAIAVAQHHKNTCNDPECGVSMHFLLELINAANLSTTPEERKIFT